MIGSQTVSIINGGEIKHESNTGSSQPRTVSTLYLALSFQGQAQTGQPDSTIQLFHPSYQHNTQNKDLIFEMKAYSLDLRNRVIETYKQGRLKKTEIGRKYRICYQTVYAVPG